MPSATSPKNCDLARSDVLSMRPTTVKASVAMLSCVLIFSFSSGSLSRSVASISLARRTTSLSVLFDSFWSVG